MRIRRTLIPSHTQPAQLIIQHASDIIEAPTMQVELCCIQHGSTTVLGHSAAVCALALIAARYMRMPVDERALVRGALLHDYFLYDWHRPDHPDNKAHGFTHPFTARRNAQRDFDVSAHECAIVCTHMFPLVPLPPMTREAWLVCLADKAVACAETVRRRPHSPDEPHRTAANRYR